MKMKANIRALAVAFAFAGAASAAVEDPMPIGMTVLQTTAVKTRGSGGDVILPDGWIYGINGLRHLRYEREWNKLPVRGGDVVVTIDANDQVVDIAQTYVPLTISKIPTLHDKDAIVAAGAAFGSGFTNKPTAQLVVWTYADGSAELAYEVWLKDASRSIMYTVDAGDGHLLGAWNWTYGASTTTTFMPYDEHCVGPAFDNFIPGTDGDSIAPDLIDHQHQHWELFSNLRPSGESGGLYEANADIAGVIHEFYTGVWRTPQQPDFGNYLIGERHPMFGANPGFTKAIRWMFDPQRDGVSLNCYAPSVANQDVHAASGIGARAFYLLAEGTGHKSFSGVDHYAPTCNGSSFAGMGRAKAVELWEDGLEGFGTSLTNYHLMRIAMLKSARFAYGEGSPEIVAVAKAWSAVGVE